MVDKPQPAGLKLKKTSLPMLFVDNNPGYVPVETISLGRRADGLYWGNIKYCMGYAVFSTNERIGVGIVKDGEIIAIVSQRLEDFFRVSFDPDQSTTSILAAIQIDYDRIFIGATAMFNGKAMYASATVSARGLALWLRTKAEAVMISGLIRSTHAGMFDAETGESDEETTPPVWGNMIVTYEGYDESEGFSYVSSERNITAIANDAAVALFDRVQDDISTLTSGSYTSRAGVFTMESFVHKEFLYILSTDGASIFINTYSGLAFTETAKELNTPSCQTEFTNVYYGRITVKGPHKWYEPRNYSLIYSPPAVIFRYNTFSGVVVSLPTGDRIYSYLLRPPVDDSGVLDFTACPPGQKLMASDSMAFPGRTCNSLAYSIGGDHVDMNSSPATKEYLMAKIDNTKATKSMMGENSLAIKSMTQYIPYSSPVEAQE